MIHKIFYLILSIFLVPIFLLAHDEGHKRPAEMPVKGPHGGAYGELTKHYAEVVVNDQLTEARVYILEKDIKNVAEDATKVTASLEIPRKETVKLTLEKGKDGGYLANISIPKGTRVAYFQVTCVLDDKKEEGKITWEIKK